jgi:hypothetical protein
VRKEGSWSTLRSTDRGLAPLPARCFIGLVTPNPGQTAIPAGFTLAAYVRRAHAESPMGAGVTSSTGSTTGGFDRATAGRKQGTKGGRGRSPWSRQRGGGGGGRGRSPPDQQAPCRIRGPATSRADELMPGEAPLPPPRTERASNGALRRRNDGRRPPRWLAMG